ncbi:hypothetical protein QTN25_002822 [Entamoeba marina]
MNNKQLDSYSLLIVSKFFKTSHDFINVMCVNSKFKETTEKLRYNPISITSLKLFPKIQTQYLYSKNEEVMKEMNKWEIWYNVDYGQYLQLQNNNLKCHHVVYTQRDRKIYKALIPQKVTILDEWLFSYIDITTITIPTTVTNICDGCFNLCTSLINATILSPIRELKRNCFNSCVNLQTIELPQSITSINDFCFNACSSLQTITLPPFIVSLGSCCFQKCSNLTSIILPNSISSIKGHCFEKCMNLQSITLSTSLTSLSNSCFKNCLNLKTIELPSSITSIGEFCFVSCTSLEIITLTPSIKTYGMRCFVNCNKLKTVNGVNITDIDIDCFVNCEEITKQHNKKCIIS